MKEIRELIHSGYPTIEEVYNSLKSGTVNRELLFRYFWPLCLTKAWEFFPDEDDARNAAVDNMERWLIDIQNYNEDIAKLSPFFNSVTQLNFINYYEWNVKNQPDVELGWVEEPENEEDEDDDFSSFSRVNTRFVDEHDYPYTGIEYNDPETLFLKKEIRRERTKELLAKLAPADRQVLLLLIAGLTSEQIEERLGRTRAAVESSLKNVRGLVDTVSTGGDGE
jgi:RNA polymerase sigma factor (sigma-70 family)